MSRTFILLSKEPKNIKFYEKVLVLVSQNAIRAKRSIQQQYNNQIIISFLIHNPTFYEKKIKSKSKQLS